MLLNPGLRALAKNEIDKSLSLSTYNMRQFGLSFDPPKGNLDKWQRKIRFVVTFFGIFYHIVSDIIFIGLAMSRSSKVEDIVPLLHTFGYGFLSSAKLFAIWYKSDVFGQRLKELIEIWPVPPLDEEAQTIKDKSLAALRIAHQWLFAINYSGVWFYNLTPLGIYFYERLMGNADAEMGFIWNCWYPFNKHELPAQVFVYFIEMFSGLMCVWAMMASDLLFSAIASHICMLLRLLHRRLAAIGTTAKNHQESYDDIIDCIKLHQRLITYCNDLEEAFSITNLVNIVLSSVNICCVVFVIVLLEPIVAVSNKLFLGSVLLQIGVVCWYSDDIFHANADVAVAAYNSCWYKTDPRSRRALIFLIKRSQKPIAFTAMNFTNINLTTYSSILTRSYSYFALLYTMYNKS